LTSPTASDIIALERGNNSMTVKEYIESRPQTVYGKKIRILNAITKKNMGEWFENASAFVLSAKITTKFIFIFI
jgi:hypothetical protein